MRENETKDRIWGVWRRELERRREKWEKNDKPETLSLWERREIQGSVTLDPEDRKGRQRRQDEVERFELGQLATSER